MNIIVGLGNPGKEYQGTRHNIGRDLLCSMAAQPPKGFEVGDWKTDNKLVAQVADFTYEGKAGRFILPDTYMNLSGKSVETFFKYNERVENLIVIHDDLDLLIGRFKISFDRGSGGHKGVESIIQAIKTKTFTRIRIGISSDSESGSGVDIPDFVLGRLNSAEQKILQATINNVITSILEIVKLGSVVAMNRAGYMR